MTTRLLAATLMLSAAAFTAPASAFDWKQASGTEITLLASEHPWTAGVRENLAEFEALTGIKVNVTAFAEDLYLDRANLAIRSEEPVADVFMTLMDAAIYEQVNVGGVAPLTPYINDVPNGNMNAAAISSVGGSQPHTNFQPYLCVDFIISLFGIFPSQT